MSQTTCWGVPRKTSVIQWSCGILRRMSQRVVGRVCYVHDTQKCGQFVTAPVQPTYSRSTMRCTDRMYSRSYAQRTAQMGMCKNPRGNPCTSASGAWLGTVKWKTLFYRVSFALPQFSRQTLGTLNNCTCHRGFATNDSTLTLAQY